MKKIRVLIIDEYPAVCRALAVRLNAISSIDVVGSACTFEEGLDKTRTFQPDVILLELKGGGEGEIGPLDAVSGLLAGGPAGLIVLTSYLDETEREGALEAGAHRYLLKQIDTAHLLGEIEAVAREAGLALLSPGIVPDASTPSAANAIS